MAQDVAPDRTSTATAPEGSGAGDPLAPPARPAPIPSRSSFAQQQLRLMSALVVLLGAGLFLALPFVLSIGAVVFLPLTAAIILTILLSPLADRLAHLGLPNLLASFLALVGVLAVLLLALALILQPAAVLIDQVPALADQIARRFGELRGSMAWVSEINEQLTRLSGGRGAEQVVIAGPSMLEQLAFATPSAVLETLLTFLMAFFMIESRVRLRRRLMLGRSDFGASLKAARMLREVQDRVAAYILTVVVINTGVGVVVALGAYAFGLQAPIMWGGLAAILNFLPYVGPVIMIAILALFGIGTSETILLGIVPAACYFGLHTVEANAVTPSILGARFTMNPVLILIALSYFSWIWGVLGALLSVPILLTLTALGDHLGRPNLIGFLLGEPLFPDVPLESEAERPTSPNSLPG